MKAIYKYPLDRNSSEVAAHEDKKTVVVFNISIPRWSEILTIQMQNETPCIWALVDQESPEKREAQIEVYGTGWDIPEPRGLRYIGTFQVHGMLVFHAFERFSRK